MNDPDWRDKDEQMIRLREDLTERVTRGEPRDRVDRQGPRPALAIVRPIGSRGYSIHPTSERMEFPEAHFCQLRGVIHGPSIGTMLSRVSVVSGVVGGHVVLLATKSCRVVLFTL